MQDFEMAIVMSRNLFPQCDMKEDLIHPYPVTPPCLPNSDKQRGRVGVSCTMSALYPGGAHEHFFTTIFYIFLQRSFAR